MTGPAGVGLELPVMPKTPLKFDPEKPLYSQQFDMSHLTDQTDELGFASRNKSYSVYDKQGGLIASGMTDEQGLTDHIFTNDATELIVLVDEDAWTVEEYFEENDNLDEVDDPKGESA